MTPEEKKEAKRLYDIQYRIKNKLKIQEYKKNLYASIPEAEKKEISKKRYSNLNKIEKAKSDKEYAKLNKDKLNQKKKNWAIANPEKNRKSKTNYVNKMMASDDLYKLKAYIRSGIIQAFKRLNYSKKSKTGIILGCSFEQLKLHIESLWEPWMNWSNYGNPKDGIYEPNKTWDIDHIIPLSSAKSEEDVIKLNHHTNLQPLCSYTNRFIKKDL